MIFRPKLTSNDMERRRTLMARNILVALIVCFGTSSRALIFNITYDTSVTSLGNAAPGRGGVWHGRANIRESLYQ
jgi:hypothetical protein